MTKNVVSMAEWELAELMGDISEDCYCAGWMMGLEHALWAMVLGGPREYGMGEVTEEQVARLKQLSDACGGWIVWSEGDGETFVPLEEWEQIARRA